MHSRRFAALAARRSAVAIALVVSITGIARAQQANLGPNVNLPAVNVTAEGAGSLATPEVLFNVQEHGIGQTITTINEGLINNTPAFQIGDILRDAPGVTIKQGNGPRDEGISIRGSNAQNGFGIRNIQVYEDGFPVTQPDGLSRTDITDPHAYGSIDVFRGPSSAMFGNYATGGAINFNMRPGSEIGGVEIGSDAGSFNYFNEYTLFGNKIGDFEYTGIISHVRSDGFQRNQGFSTTTGDILASYTPTLDDRITVKVIDNYVGTALPIRLSLNQFRQNPFQQGCPVINAATTAAGCASVSLFLNGVNGATVPQTADEAGLGRHDQRTILGARWEHSFDSDTVWRTQLVYDNKDINQPTGATSALFDEPAFNLMSDITQKGNFFGTPETHFFQAWYNNAHVGSDTFNVAPGGNATLGALTSLYYGHQYNTGARVREEMQFDPYWTGEAGAGAEYTNLQANDTIYNFASSGVLTGTTLIPALREFVNVAPEASLHYRPNDEWQFRSRVGTGYGTPQAGNLFVTPTGIAGNNTQLQTQTNVGLDAGADWTPTNTVTVNVTGFYESFHNELVTQSPGAGLSSYTFNAPKSEHRGIEAAVNWRFLPGWQAIATWLRDDQFYEQYMEQLSAGTKIAIFNRSGNRIPGVEPNDVYFRLAYDQPTGFLAGLGAFVETYWRDSFFMDNANLIKAPGYAVVNLNLHYDPSVHYDFLKGMSVFFEVENLFNKTYVASANNVSDSLSSTTGLQNPASVEAGATGSIYAGAPRTFVGGIKLRF
jgi:iron complex outermembrane receptor protein